MMRFPLVSSHSLKRLGVPALAATLVLAGYAATPAVAQNAPPQVNPGLILQPEEQDIKKRPDIGQPDRQKNIKEDADEVKVDVPEQDTGATGAAGGPSFEVTHIELQGNTIFSDEELQPILDPYENREVTLDDLGKAVDAIMQRYRDEGYMTTQAYVPPQDIENGIVKIQVVEGTVGQIEVSGNKYYKAWAVARDVGYEPGEPLNITNLEDTLNQINRRGNFRLRAVLKAGENPGETDVRFAVAERQPWQISPTWDNQGRPFVGMYRWGAAINNSNLTGIGDRLSTQYFGAKGTQVGAISYFAPLNSHGTEVGYSYAYSFVDVEIPKGKPGQGAGTFNDEITGYANNHSLIISQPLDDERVWSIDGAFNAKRITSRLHTIHANEDDIRSLSFGVNFNKLDRTGRTFVRLQTDVAPGWMATNRRTFRQHDKAPSAPGAVTVTAGGRQFWKAYGFAQRLQRMPWPNHLLILRASGQFTPDDLPSAEEFQVGGAFSVRGYTEGLLIGDRGYTASAEYRMPIPGLNYISEWLYNRVQVAGFFDMGQAWMDESNPFYNSVGNTRRNSAARTLLMGAGVGLRARLTRYLIGFVDLGFPLTNNRYQVSSTTVGAGGPSVVSVEPLAQPDVRVHFGIRSDLLPDEYKERDTETTTIKEKAFMQRMNSISERVAAQEEEDAAFWNNQQRSLGDDLDTVAEPIDPDEMDFDSVYLEDDDADFAGEQLSAANTPQSVKEPPATEKIVTTETIDNNQVEADTQQDDNAPQLQFDYPVALPMIR